MSPKSLKFAAAAGVLAAGLVGGSVPFAHAGVGSCSQPVSSGVDPVATDCLFILRAAVGSTTCSKPCICQPRGISPTKASDALVCLQYSVGQPVEIDCACGAPDVESSDYTFDPDTAIADPNVAARYVKTTYYGAFSQDQNASVGDWTEDWTVKLHGNNKIWEPASGGTLAGGTPSANGSCPTGTTDIGDQTLPASVGGGSMDLCELAGRYNTDGQTITLTNDNIYRINQAATTGTIFGNGDALKVVAPSIVPPGGYTNPVDTHLVIEPGTLVLGGSGEALVISRGSDITINGTEADPVVLDSQAAFDAWVGGNDNGGAQGQWSGLVLNGFGIINTCNDATSCDAEVEGIDGTVFYGSPNTSGITNWDCGDIEYLVIDNPGFDQNGMGDDTNGLTVYGCDYPTTLSYIQANNSLDDGMEFFGGSAVGDHFVATNNLDDNFDSDFGYQGGIQFGLVIQGADGDKGFEADNSTSVGAFTPLSNPNYANITVLNNPATVQSGGGLSLRTVTAMNMWNVIQTNGKGYGIRSEASTGTVRGINGSDQLVFENVWLYDPLPVESATNGILRGTDATDKTNLTSTFDAGSNNVRSAVLNPGLDAVGFPDQTP